MEGTTTLADALLGDLDDLMDSDDEDQNEVADNEDIDTSNNASNTEENVNDTISATQSKPSSANELEKATTAQSQFLDNRSLQKHLKIIRDHNDSRGDCTDKDNSKVTPYASAIKKRKEEEENHHLVVQSNKYLTSLAEEMRRAHSNLTETYRPKFPELEDLLPNPLHYKNAIRIIGNETDLTKVNDELNEILSSNQIITISMAGSTTSGRALTESELKEVDAAATYTEELLLVQKDLMKFVENSMENLCPSICALIEAPTAARLLGLAGGLQELTKVSIHGEVRETSELYVSRLQY
uniref:NOSIC domain-containing protein n=1 Tax=Pseudo-nitzschia australis TaxID=44445 RepID=A0A7S4A9D5_9STRA